MEKGTRIHYFVSIVTAVLFAILGISLAITASVIYFTGDEQPYTRESVAEGLKYVIAPAVLTFASIVASAVLKLIYPENKEKIKPLYDEERSLIRQSERLREKNPEALSDITIVSEREYRKRIRITLYAVLSALGILALIISLISKYDLDSINQSVIKVVSVVFSLALVAGAVSYIFGKLSIESMRRENEAVKELLKSTKKSISAEKNIENNDKNGLYINIARASIAVLAVVFIIIGIFNGGMSDVLGKAVRICTECIGLG